MFVAHLQYNAPRLTRADIDAEISPEDRRHAQELIAMELPRGYDAELHPLIPRTPEISHSELMSQEIARAGRKEPMRGGIDTSRYEALELPRADSDSDEDRSAFGARLREALQQAYSSSTHLHTRLNNLALLEQFGKNAWLVGNSQLEDILRAMEKDLVATREQTEDVNKARKQAQEMSRGDLEALTEAWKEGVGKVIEVEVAAEGLHGQILDQRRRDAQNL